MRVFFHPWVLIISLLLWNSIISAKATCIINHIIQFNFIYYKNATNRMLYQKIKFEYIFLLLNYNENNFNILYTFPVKVEIFLNRIAHSHSAKNNVSSTISPIRPNKRQSYRPKVFICVQMSFFEPQ